MFAHRQSRLAGRGRLRGLLVETMDARQAIEHEAHRFAEMQGGPRPVVVADQLFPTPPALAARVVELARLEAGQRVLEPSAGTGNLIQAALAVAAVDVVAVEIQWQLADVLRRGWPGAEVYGCDFLDCGAELGKFDRIVMNPPFTRRSDVRHIEHARNFLSPGGRLVAICMIGANRDRLRDEASEWIDLPPRSFRESGTDVNAAIVVFE